MRCFGFVPKAMIHRSKNATGSERARLSLAAVGREVVGAGLWMVFVEMGGKKANRDTDAVSFAQRIEGHAKKIPSSDLFTNREDEQSALGQSADPIALFPAGTNPLQEARLVEPIVAGSRIVVAQPVRGYFEAL